MAENWDPLPVWAYSPTAEDIEEVKVAAEKEENRIDQSLTVVGQFINETDCVFVYDAQNRKFLLNDKEIYIRYCNLRKFDIEGKETRYGIDLSTKTVDGEYVKHLMFFDSYDDILKIVNVCRRRLHSMGWHVNYLSPLWTGWLNIWVSGDGTVLDEFYVIMDEEGIFLYTDHMAESPRFYLQFYKEQLGHSIEKARTETKDNAIVLDTAKSGFIIQNASKHSDFTDVFRNILPKSASMFQYNTSQSDDQEQLQTAETSRIPWKKIRERQLQRGGRFMVSGPGDDLWEEDIYQRERGFQGKQARIIADELDHAVVQFGGIEDLSLPWIVAENELIEMIAHPEVLGQSEQDMISGGLDPNDTDHLMKSLNEIKDLLGSQRYETALCRLKGTKEIFLESTITEIRSLISQDDVQLLKKLYFHSFM